ncbi:histidine phosphatase family protein [Paenibacillus humicus]|uniref:histidine phosphatase family protein n=1 Tax=Paenibacillus humicus TaxID=412861 RepID=UPI000FD7823C|nr:histidine phosphatase family protein [Paenibacillus humicus]
MDILIVRHGESVADIEERMEGRANYPLTDKGRGQAVRAAQWIATHFQPVAVFTSPLSRAVECAEIIAKTVGIKVTKDDNLLDWNHGVLAGMLRSEAATKYPEVPGGRKPHEAIEGGESDIELRARAETFISKLLHTPAYQDKTVLLVAHTMTINKLFDAFLGLPISRGGVRFHGLDTGIHHWRFHEGYKYILMTNSQEHLKDASFISGEALHGELSQL